MNKKILAIALLTLATTGSANAGWKNWFGFENNKAKGSAECAELSKEECGEKRFQGIDTDNNGMLSKTEYMAHAEKMKEQKMMMNKNSGKGMGQKTPEERFEMMDTNNDSMVSKEEMKTWKNEHKHQKKNMNKNGYKGNRI